MKIFLTTVLLLTVMLLVTGCKSNSQLQSKPNRERFLFLVVKNESGVLEGLLSGCSCFEVVRFEVIDKQEYVIDFFNSQPKPATTIRILLKVKNEAQLLSLQQHVDEMQEIVSINFIKQLFCLHDSLQLDNQVVKNQRSIFLMLIRFGGLYLHSSLLSFDLV